MDNIAMLRSIICLEAVGVTDCSNILKLAKLRFTFALANPNLKQIFPTKRVESNYRNQLSEKPYSSLMRIVMDGKPYAEDNSTKAVDFFLKKSEESEDYLRGKITVW